MIIYDVCIVFGTSSVFEDMYENIILFCLDRYLKFLYTNTVTLTILYMVIINLIINIIPESCADHNSFNYYREPLFSLGSPYARARCKYEIY